jgi:hypothetical protein
MYDPQNIISIQLNIHKSNPHLLDGLDALLRLGLVTDEQIRQLCQELLTSPLPPLVVAELIPELIPELSPELIPESPPEPAAEISPRPSTPEPLRPGAPTAPPPPSYIAQGLKSLMAELSVQWLLFLGVFMVTLSSGVLVATQWEQFPPFGQYLVLFAYTCLFWLVSQWAVKQSNLQLTAQTLQTATMLLVPLNFWAMDGFHLWDSLLGWITAAIAAMSLTAMTIGIYPSIKTSVKNIKKAPYSSIAWVNYIFVSFIHWGWGLPFLPLIAVYLGTISSSLTTVYQTNYQKKISNYIGYESSQTEQILDNAKANQRSDLFLIYAIAVLLFRGIFLQGIQISQLGLAIGISGWLFVWLSEKNPPDAADSAANVTPDTELPLSQIGIFLLCLGWLISFASIPWTSEGWQPWEALQAMGVSALGLWLLFRRFLANFNRNKLTAIFLIGLQACILIGQIIPPGFRSQAVNTAVEIAQAADAPFTIYAITLIPYLILTVWFTDWIYRQDKPNAIQCGLTGDYLSLGLGTGMALLSLANANVRSLNLIATTMILAIITYRRLISGIGLPNTDSRQHYSFPPVTTATSLTLVYLTHIFGGFTGFSIIDRFLPNLSPQIWGIICLGAMVVELAVYLWADYLWADYLWAESSNQNRKVISYWAYFFEESAYYVGLGLAGLSYYLLNHNMGLNYPPGTQELYGIWLIAPISLTGVAYLSKKRRIMACWLSAIALVMANLIILEMPVIRLIGFALATVLMLINTGYLRQTGAAAMTVGFGLSLTAFVLDFGIFGLPPVTGNGWLVVAAVAIAVLVLLHKYLSPSIEKQESPLDPPLPSEVGNEAPAAETKPNQSKSLGLVYAPALNGWAVFLSAFLLIALTAHSFTIYSFGSDIVPPQFNLHFNALIATIIVTVALAYWNFPIVNNRSIYALAWCIEILAVETLAFFARSLLTLAIANIVLGLASQLLGDWYYSRQASTAENEPRSLDIIPLAYAVLGTIFRSGTLTSWTGLTTLGLALTAIGVGRRSPQGKLLIYFALVGVWLSAYEVLYYQISAFGTGDQLVAIAALTTGILYAYRLLTPWLTYYLKLTKEELVICAHTHWVLGSSLLIAALAYPITLNSLLGIGTGALLARYAIGQGRHNPYQNIAETWVYLGLIETAILLIYAVTQLPDFWSNWVISWAGAIATIIAYFFYFIPWQKWGWPWQPWQTSAVILPITTALIFGGNLSSSTFVPSSLLMPAAFYMFLAWFNRRSANSLRFTYVSGFLIDWALIRWLVQINFTEPLGYVIPIAFLFLYIAQVDPDLKTSEQKETRSLIRFCATGAICLMSWFTANWLVTGFICIMAIFAGLIFRVRAYLYVGTSVFLLNAIYQMVILISQQPQLKWAIGLLVGIAFIWIAATFERSRQKIITLVQQAIAELETWE